MSPSSTTVSDAGVSASGVAVRVAVTTIVASGSPLSSGPTRAGRDAVSSFWSAVDADPADAPARSSESVCASTAVASATVSATAIASVS